MISRLLLLLMLLLAVSFKSKESGPCPCIIFDGAHLITANCPWSEYGTNITELRVNQKIRITSIRNIDNDTIDYEIKLLDRTGRAFVKTYHNKSLVSTGHFTNTATETIHVEGKEIQRYRAKEDGLWKYYNDAGKLQAKIIFEQGRIISEREYTDCTPSSTFLYEYQKVFSPELKKSTLVHIHKDTTMEFHLFNCEGEAKVKIYKAGKLIIKGEYGKTDKTLPEFQYYNREEEGWVDNMFECTIPVKDGKWTYYDMTGRKIKKERWKTDSLLSTKTY